MRDRAMILHRVPAGDAHGPGVDVQQPADRPNGRCLSSSVRSNEAEHLTGFDSERHLAQRLDGAKAFHDAIEFDDGSRRRAFWLLTSFFWLRHDYRRERSCGYF